MMKLGFMKLRFMTFGYMMLGFMMLEFMMLEFIRQQGDSANMGFTVLPPLDQIKKNH